MTVTMAHNQRTLKAKAEREKVSGGGKGGEGHTAQRRSLVVSVH